LIVPEFRHHAGVQERPRPRLCQCSTRLVILLGAPGSGKGTQAKRIAGQYRFRQLSTGDMLRDNLSRPTELARKAKAFMDRGELVPDDIVLGMVQERLAQSERAGGFVLDGFPRTVQQAQTLETLCRSYESRSTIVLNFVVPPELLVARLTNRRICTMNGHIYNLIDRPPIHPGICDADGSELIRRPDDNEDVIRVRLRAYERQTVPLIDHYSAQGMLHEIEAMGDPEMVTTNIARVLDNSANAKG